MSPERLSLTRHAETTTPTVFHGAESHIGLGDIGRRQAVAATDWFRRGAGPGGEVRRPVARPGVDEPVQGGVERLAHAGQCIRPVTAKIG